MTLALSLFVLFYILMLAVQQYRPWVALGGAGAFLLLGKLGVYDFTLADAARAVDFNVLLMMAGMMGTVFLFIQSKMPARLAGGAHCPCAGCPVGRVGAGAAGRVHQCLCGQCGHRADGGSGRACHRPAAEAIAGAGAHRHCGVVQFTGRGNAGGDTTSILLGGFAGMNFFDFFWMEGRPGIFWSVELGALASLGCCSGCSGTSASPSMSRWKRRWRTTSPRRFSC